MARSASEKAAQKYLRELLKALNRCFDVAANPDDNLMKSEGTAKND